MHRKVLGMLLVLGAVSACTQPLRVCETDGDCPGGGLCDVERHLCFGGTELLGACEPACAEYQACGPARSCVARYTELVVTPGDGGVVGAGAVPVRAELRVASGFAENFPETLSFSVVRSDGGTASTLGPVTGSGGVYTTQWTPPGEGEFLLTAAYPASGGPSTTVRLTVDTTPPSFTVVVPAADAGVADGGTTYTDPAAGFATAWRRDQVVPVEIRTNEPNLDPSTVMVALQGTDGGSAPAVAVTPVTGACDAGFCGTAELKLWEPAFDAFRGALPIVVQGRDRVGNASNAPAANVNVTRWRWVFDGSSGGNLAIKAPPAVGAQGAIYFGASSASVGKVFALRPDGTTQWEVNTGLFVSGPTVGTLNANVEKVYVGVNPSTSAATLLALNGSTGVEVGRCDINKGQIGSSLALTQIASGGGSVETALAVINVNLGGTSGIVGSLVALRPEGAVTPCNTTDPVVRSQSSSTGVAPLVIQGDTVFYAESSGRLTSYQLGSTTARSGWPVPTGFSINGLALAGSDVVGANGGQFSDQGLLFSIPKMGGGTSPAWRYPTTSDMFINQFSIGAGSNIFFGSENLPSPASSAGLATVPLGGTSLNVFQSGAGSFKGAPVLGSGNALFAATDGTALVGAWSTDIRANRWSLASGVGPTSISPALDCARDATGAARAENLGALYVAEGGKLFAFVVDSRGLDGAAPWPKYQHDSRNTGNPDTPLSSCP
ncbi:hypothetical protein [Archangium sp.]|uniref:hypothetical protein n=1 Tax=Archangium sp. TaxID=1872627 RepID=UPI003899F6F3